MCEKQISMFITNARIIMNYVIWCENKSEKSSRFRDHMISFRRLKRKLAFDKKKKIEKKCALYMSTTNVSEN